MADQAAELARDLAEGKFPEAAPAELAAAIDALVKSLAQPDFALHPKHARALAKELNEQVYYHLTRSVAEAWSASKGFDATVSKAHAQALINLDALDEAENLLTHGLQEIRKPDASAHSRSELLEYEGLLGRIWKQRFVNEDDQDALAKAIDHYRAPYERDDDRPFWHGMNYAALLARQARDAGTSYAKAATVAQAIYDDVQARYRLDTNNPWVASTASEAALALGRCEEAEHWLGVFLKHPKLKPFKAESYGRQLREIWKADPTGDDAGCANRLIKMLERHIAAEESRWSVSPAEVDAKLRLLRLDRAGFQATFTGQPAFTPEEVASLLAACPAVGSVCNKGNARFGTGFLIQGDRLKEQYGPDLVFVTNAHVMGEGVPKAVPPGDALVTFEVHNTRRGEPKFYKVRELLFTSEPAPLGRPQAKGLDITIVRLEAIGRDFSGLQASEHLPPVDDNAHAFVIGYPQGAGLRISLHDSQLLAIDAGQRLLHYRTPTDNGNSGSPVFDTRFNVIGVHRGGLEKMPMLNGPGTYKANEGVTLLAIQQMLN
ncbi:MAG TPA: serine protease [Burkholderiales bacterium]|nr:serine protease [Burkholderiales bacterium]